MIKPKSQSINGSSPVTSSSSSTNTPLLDSSNKLRELITLKRKSGQLQSALALAKLGRRIVILNPQGLGEDEVSRQVFELYLELTPDDEDVRQALNELPQLTREPTPPSAHKKSYKFPLIISVGLVVIAAIGVTLFHPSERAFNTSPTNSSKQIVQASSEKHLKISNASSQAAMSSDSSSISSAAVATQLSQPIVIRAVGDIVLGTDYPHQKLPDEKQKQLFIQLSQFFNHADVVFGNLEGVLSDAGTSTKDMSKSGYFSFRMPTAYAELIKKMGFNVLSVANNHSMDFGVLGLNSTITSLHAQAIQVSGSNTEDSAMLIIRNTKIIFLSYSYLPGLKPMSNEVQIKMDIVKAKQKANLVFVSVHAGGEGEAAAGIPLHEEYFMNEDRGNIQKFAELVIDAGADGVFGHGPHVVRPFDIYKHKPIFYSLGNFIGFRTLSTKGKLDQSMIAEVKFNEEGKFLSAGIIPLKMNHLGIPSVDYSATTLDTLDKLLDENLDKQPLLHLHTTKISEQTTKISEQMSSSQITANNSSSAASLNSL